MMNRSQLPHSNWPEQEANLTYDLAEGHNKTLKGSMNQTELPEGYEDYFLSLAQERQVADDL
jgi:hypothetical protein